MILDELRQYIEKHGRLTLLYPKNGKWVYYRGQLTQDGRILEYENYIVLDGAAPAIVAMASIAKDQLVAEAAARGTRHYNPGGPGRGG